MRWLLDIEAWAASLIGLAQPEQTSRSPSEEGRKQEESSWKMSQFGNSTTKVSRIMVRLTLAILQCDLPVTMPGM